MTLLPSIYEVCVFSGSVKYCDFQFTFVITKGSARFINLLFLHGSALEIYID